MVQQVRKVKIFVASPRDVTAERAYLQQAIDEINRTQGKQQEFILELLTWEHTVHPEMGRPQEVITKQIGQYDIFIGIMWKRFGTPTGKADSGTEEEFRNAYEAWLKDQTRPILFYFCEQPFMPLTHEDLTQMGKVLAFREELNRLGLTWAYPNADAFLPIVREHLSNVIDSVIRNRPQKAPHRIPSIKTDEMEFTMPGEQELLPAVNCSLALAFGKRISAVNSIEMHSRFRQSLVDALAQRERYFADAVVPIPHAGVFLATCWSEVRPERLWLAFGYSRFGSAMFRMPKSTEERLRHAANKVGSVVEPDTAKSVFLIDEAVLSGSTMNQAVATLRDYGVTTIHVRTLMPPVVKACPYKVTTYEPGAGFDKEWQEDPRNWSLVARVLDADDYACLSKEEIRLLGLPRGLCVECLNVAEGR